MQRICADAGYRGTFINRGVDILEKIKAHEWEKLKWCWEWNERLVGSMVTDD